MIIYSYVFIYILFFLFVFTQGKLTPSKLKDKISQREQESSAAHLDTSKVDRIKTHRKDERVATYTVDEAWQSFLQNLKANCEAFGVENNKGLGNTTKDKNIGMNKSLSVNESDDVLSNSYSVTSNAAVVGPGNKIASNAIRMKELEAMNLEDKLRKKYLKQLASIQSKSKALTIKNNSLNFGLFFILYLYIYIYI
jgi:hypothetical protein